MFPKNPVVVADMTALHHIHEPGILHNLKERSRPWRQTPYTFMVSPQCRFSVYCSMQEDSLSHTCYPRGKVCCVNPTNMAINIHALFGFLRDVWLPTTTWPSSEMERSSDANFVNSGNLAFVLPLFVTC